MNLSLKLYGEYGPSAKTQRIYTKNLRRLARESNLDKPDSVES